MILENVLGHLQDKATGAVLQRWPGTEIGCGWTEEWVTLAWEDGPARDAVDELTRPYQQVNLTVKDEAIGYEHTHTVNGAVRLRRKASSRAQLLAAGVALLELGVPGLPRQETYDEAGADRDLLRGRGPYDPELRRQLLFAAGVYGDNQWSREHLTLARALLDRTDLFDVNSLLPTGRDEAFTAACFATLAADDGVEILEDALLYAASGGWELATTTSWSNATSR